MTYRVHLTAAAETAIDDFISFVANERQEPINAAKLLLAIRDAATTLEVMPQRCPRAPEDSFVAYTVRMLIVKKTLILLYRIDEEARLVNIIGFRHASRLPRPEDLPGKSNGA